MAASLADDENLLAQMTERAWQDVALPASPGMVTIRLTALASQPQALHVRILRHAVEKLRPTGPDAELDDPLSLEARHFALIERLITSATTGSALELPHRLRATRGYDELRLSLTPVDQARVDASDVITAEWSLNAPGAVEAVELGWRVRVAISDAPPGLEGDALPPQPNILPPGRAGTAGAMPRGEWRVYADADVAGERFTVRAWRPGDRFRPLGMRRAKKLQDIFADAKIPRALRGHLPLICAGAGADERIVWVAGVRVGDEFRLSAASRRTLVLQAEPLDLATATPEPV